MKKTILILAFGCTFLGACKKETQPIVKEKTFSFVSTPGSYWVYQNYLLDRNGIKYKVNMDTVYVIGDTTINQNTFVAFKGTLAQNKYEFFQRDSSGYLVDEGGNRKWSNHALGELMSYSNARVIGSTAILSVNKELTLPLGTYNTIEKVENYCYTDGLPVTKCDSCVSLKSYYAEGLGVVYQELVKTSFCETLVHELVSFGKN